MLAHPALKERQWSTVEKETGNHDYLFLQPNIGVAIQYIAYDSVGISQLLRILATVFF